MISIVCAAVAAAAPIAGEQACLTRIKIHQSFTHTHVAAATMVVVVVVVVEGVSAASSASSFVITFTHAHTRVLRTRQPNDT